MRMLYLIVLWEIKLEKSAFIVDQKRWYVKAHEMKHLIGAAIAADTTSVVVSVWILQQFTGYYVQGAYTIAQIAERLGISYSTV